MSGVILSCENKQEFVDLLAIANALRDRHGRKIYYFDITNLLTGGEGEFIEPALFSKCWQAFAIQGRPFKVMPVWLKLLISLVNALYLSVLYYSRRVDFVLVGTPLLTYRLARILTFGNLRLVTYIRGVIARSDENTSVSSRIFLKFQRLMHYGVFSRIFSDYYADLVFCVGDVTADFIASRGVPRSKIKVIGSIFCDRHAAPIGDKGEKTVVFVSSAFAFHGYDDAQAAQAEMIRRMRKYIGEKYKNLKFLVRRHPREAASLYEGELAGCVDARVGDPLIGYPSNSLFLSTVSTLVFELAYVGRKSCIVADDFFACRFRDWYEALELNPIFDWKGVIDSYALGSYKEVQDYSHVIAVSRKGRVVDEIVAELKNFCFI